MNDSELADRVLAEKMRLHDCPSCECVVPRCNCSCGCEVIAVLTDSGKCLWCDDDQHAKTQNARLANE